MVKILLVEDQPIMMKLLQSILAFLFALLISTSVSAQNDTLKTSFGEGADTYVSNDEQYTDLPPEGSGPESIHGTEEYLKIRNRYFEARNRVVSNKFKIQISNDRRGKFQITNSKLQTNSNFQ